MLWFSSITEYIFEWLHTEKFIDCCIPFSLYSTNLTKEMPTSGLKKIEVWVQRKEEGQSLNHTSVTENGKLFEIRKFVNRVFSEYIQSKSNFISLQPQSAE